jgi:asparagine synthase (glutamine-hydrolysing)
VRKWWSLAEVAEQGQRNLVNLGDDEVTAEVERLLQLAVGERMIADVPLGAFLSGGIDSSAVVALMQARSSRPVRTFTIGFGETQFDESGDASRVARHLGTEHIESRLAPAEACAVIPELPSVWDEPFAAESQIPTLLLSRLARQQVTVALTGDGGDEVFGGYPRHFGAPQLGLLLASPLQPRRAAAWILRMLDARAQEWLLRKALLPAPLRDGFLAGKAVRLMDAGGESELYDRLISLAPPISSRSRPAAAEQGGLPALSELAARMMYRDSVTYLPGDILVKVDRASMAASLETRCPLLDHRLLEFAWRLPISAKIRHGSGKWILRRILRRYLPEELFGRPKHGFNVPLGSWLRGPLRDWAEDLLAEPRLAADGFASRKHVAACWQGHLSGRRNGGHELWAILMAEAWLRAQPRHQIAGLPTLRPVPEGNLLALVPGH